MCSRFLFVVSVRVIRVKYGCCMHTTWLSHAYHMGITCTPHGYYMHTTWLLHAHHMAITCTPHGYHMHTTWLLHAHHMAITCTPHGYYMHTTWVSHAHHMCITCTPHGYHMYTTWLSNEYHFVNGGIQKHLNTTFESLSDPKGHLFVKSTGKTKVDNHNDRFIPARHKLLSILWHL